MKGLLTFLTIVLLTTIAFAQAPQAFNYSAVVRNGSGNPIPNQLVKFRLNILRGSVTGTSVYAETHSTTTDGNGLVNLEIGRGTILSGVFAAIPWNNDAFFFQVEVDPAGGNTFTLMGTTQFLSVPYALNAKYAENVAAQFGLFIQTDTLYLFRGDSNTGYNVNIRWFGGNQENFTHTVTNVPIGVTYTTPLTNAYNSSVLNNSADFYLPQTLNVSNSATPGNYGITHTLTTASNRIVQKNFILHLLSDCELVSYMMGKRFVFTLEANHGLSSLSCYVILENVTVVPNTSNPTCGIALQFSNGNKLNLDVNKGNLIISSTQNIGNFTRAGFENFSYNNITFNSGTTINSWLPGSSYGPLYFIYPEKSVNASGTVTSTDANPISYCLGAFNTLFITLQPIP